MYKKQNKWAVGSDINVINESIKKIGLDSGLNNRAQLVDLVFQYSLKKET